MIKAKCFSAKAVLWLVVQSLGLSTAISGEGVGMIARITTHDRDGSMSLGSGAWIGEKYVLTAAHILDKRVSNNSTSVRFPLSSDKRQFAARVIAVNELDDVALLEIPTPRLPIAAAIASEPPRHGEMATNFGFGSGRYGTGSGPVRNGPGVRITGNGVPVLSWATNNVRQGDSGGPVTNAKGQIVSVLSGGTPGTAMGVHTVRLNGFVRKHIGNIGQRLRNMRQGRAARVSKNASGQFT